MKVVLVDSTHETYLTVFADVELGRASHPEITEGTLRWLIFRNPWSAAKTSIWMELR